MCKIMAWAIGLSASATVATLGPSFQPAIKGVINALSSWVSSEAIKARVPTVVMPRSFRYERTTAEAAASSATSSNDGSPPLMLGQKLKGQTSKPCLHGA